MKPVIRTFLAVCVFLSIASHTFGAQILFNPRLSVSEEHTDNVFFTRDNKEHDLISLVSPGFTVEILGKRNGTTISYDPSYTFYDRNPEQDGWRHEARFSNWSSISRNTRIEMHDDYLYTDDPLTAGPAINITRISRESHYTNNAGVEVTHQFSGSNSFNMSYNHDLRENDDPEIADRSGHTGAVSLTYWDVPGQDGFTVDFSYGDGKYSDTPVDLGYEYDNLTSSVDITYWFIPDEFGLESTVTFTGAEFTDATDDFESWYGSIRLLNRFKDDLDGFIQYERTDMNYSGPSEDYQMYEVSTGLIYLGESSFSVDIGYYVRDPEDSDDSSNWTIDGDIGKTWSAGRSSIGLTGSSGYRESYFGYENLGFSTYYEGEFSVQYGFSRRTEGNISCSFRRDKYEDIEPERKDETTNASMGITSRPKEWLTVELTYSFNKVKSTVDAFEYEENRGFLRISISPSHPVRF